MDCRKSLFLALGLVAGAGGCSTLLPARPTDAQAAKAGEEKPHKPATYVAFGDYRASASCTKGIAPAQQQQYREDAKEAYLKALEIDPKYGPAYLALARLQQMCEDHAGAAATYEKAIQLNPQDATLWYQHGMCQCRMKNWNGAVQSLRKANELDSANRQYSSTLGFTLARAGQYTDSFRVLAQQFGEAKAHSDLARMLHHLHQPQLAREQALLALRKDPQEQAAKTLLAALDQEGKGGNPGRNAQQGGIQTVAYHEAAGPRQVQPATPGGSADATVRSIRVPPLPVISMRSNSE
jgi:tetratricopeptide (TPR) repeat protein